MELDVCELKPCFVKLSYFDIPTESYVKLEKLSKLQTKTLAKTLLSRDEKILILPKKKTQKQVPKKAVKSGRVTKKKRQAKFQLKISAFFKSDRASPDSGISSRPITPEDSDIEDNDEATESGNNSLLDHSTTEENANQVLVKKQFLDSLDDEGVDSNDEQSSEDDDSDWDGQNGDSINAQNRRKNTLATRKLKKKKVRESGIKIESATFIKSEYERDRDKRIREKDEMLAALKAQWESYKATTAPIRQPRVSKGSGTPRPPRTVFTGELRRSGRSTGAKAEYCELDEDTARLARIRRSPSGAGYRFNEKEFRWTQVEKSQSSRHDVNVNVLQPEDVTSAMLSRIHRNGQKKVYNSDVGTCCHQCRQKTIDTKTVCRSGFCVGMKGQFCGTCLHNRYGELAEEALKDPNWQCPPCRRICNCSFCLETPTGQLYHLAKSKGFPSVHHYLQDLRHKWDQEMQQDNEKEEEATSETDHEIEEEDKIEQVAEKTD